MAPSRPLRTVDDARSETSSTIFNPKEKSSVGSSAANGGVSKQKKTAAGVSASTAKKLAAAPAAVAAAATASANGAAAAPTTTTAGAGATETDPSAPRIDWTAFSVTILHTYRTAYRLPTQASHTHPHADLIYKSSRTALRSPSAVLARQKLRDLKHQRRKAAHQANSKARSRGAEKDKDTDSSSNSDHLLKPYTNTQPDGHNPPDHPSISADDSASTSTSQPAAQPSIILPEYIGKQAPTSLATAVRKHFNAQQLNEATVVSRFAYIAKQSRADHAAIKTDGSAGDGDGCWMGSHGREIRRGHGGEVGFRLRFTP